GLPWRRTGAAGSPAIPPLPAKPEPEPLRSRPLSSSCPEDEQRDAGGCRCFALDGAVANAIVARDDSPATASDDGQPLFPPRVRSGSTTRADTCGNRATSRTVSRGAASVQAEVGGLDPHAAPSRFVCSRIFAKP